jgi:excisionase family DNA binding protein
MTASLSHLAQVTHLADQETFTKAEAATYIGVSVRTLMRLTGAKAGVAHLPKRRESAPTMYAKAELDRYLQSVSGTPIVSGVVTPDTHGAKNTPANMGVSRVSNMTGVPSVPLEEMIALMAQPLSVIVERLEEMKAAPYQLPPAPNGQATLTVPVADKLMLSLVEAAQLSGLSRGHLREAIEAKKLKARIIGRGWKVKRADLEAYIAKL